MKTQLLKYIYTLVIVLIAIFAIVSLWNYYMESPWTRDGRIAADYIPITSSSSGVISQLDVMDNQKVSKGAPLFSVISMSDEGMLTHLQQQLNSITDKQSKEALALQRQIQSVTKSIKPIQIYSPAEGYVTNLKLRKGSAIAAGQPLFVIVDSNSFYVIGYFEESKLKNIKLNAPTDIYIYSKQKQIKGYVESISHAVYDNNVENSSDMIPKVQTNVPWISLAQRVPVKIRIAQSNNENLDLIAGTTCSISIHY